MIPAAIHLSEPELEITEPVTEPIARKPRIWTPFVVLFASLVAGGIFAFGAEFLVGLATGFVMGFKGIDLAAAKAIVNAFTSQPIPALLLALIPTQAGFIAVPIIAALLSKEPAKERLGLVPQSGREFGVLKLASLAGFTIVTATIFGAVATLFLGQPEANVLSNAMTVDSLWQLTLVSILISVIPGLVEEVMFRGYIQRRLLQRWSPMAAILMSSALFAAMHMDSLQHIIAVIPVGLVLGLLAHRTNSIRPGMLVHGLHNVTCVLIANVGRLVIAKLSDETAGLVTLGVFAALIIISMPAVVSLVRRDKKVVEEQPEPRPSLPAFGVDSHLVGQAA